METGLEIGARRSREGTPERLFGTERRFNDARIILTPERRFRCDRRPATRGASPDPLDREQATVNRTTLADQRQQLGWHQLRDQTTHDLVCETRSLLEALPSPQARTLSDSVAGAQTHVSSALRQHAREHIDAQHDVTNLVSGVRGLLETLSSPLAQELASDLQRADSAVAVALRDRIKALEEARSDVSSLVCIARDVLEALPSPQARNLASDLMRSATPVSIAIRGQARPEPGSDCGRPESVASSVSDADQDRQIKSESQVSSLLAQRVAQHEWPYPPESSSDLLGRDILHRSSMQLIQESQKLLTQLPDEDASKVLMTMLESGSELAAAMRSRMPATQHARLFLPSERPSSILKDLAGEGERLLNLLPQSMAEDVVGQVSSDTNVAGALREKQVIGGLAAHRALLDLAKESTPLVSGLSDEQATDLLHAMMEGESTLSAAVRQHLYEAAMIQSNETALSSQQARGATALSFDAGAWSGMSRRWWCKEADASFDSVLSSNASLVNSMKEAFGHSRASAGRADVGFLKSMSDTAQWFSSRVQPKAKCEKLKKRLSTSRQSMRSVTFFLMLQSSVRVARQKFEQEMKEEADAKEREKLDELRQAEDRAAKQVRRVVFASTKARLQTEKEWRAAKNAERLRPVTDMVAALHNTVALCDEQIAKNKEIEGWRKYNKRALKHNKREGISLYERVQDTFDIILNALPEHDDKKLFFSERNRRILLESESEDSTVCRPTTAGTYRTDQSALNYIELKQASEYTQYLPWTLRKLKRVVVEGKGDLSYKTLADLEDKIRQHLNDQASMREETAAAAAAAEKTNDEVDEALLPLEDKHIDDLDKLHEDRESFEEQMLAKVEEHSVRLQQTIARQEAEKKSLDALRSEYDEVVKQREDRADKVKALERLLNERNKNLISARAELDKIVKDRRQKKLEWDRLQELRANRKKAYLEARESFDTYAAQSKARRAQFDALFVGNTSINAERLRVLRVAGNFHHGNKDRELEAARLEQMSWQPADSQLQAIFMPDGRVLKSDVDSPKDAEETRVRLEPEIRRLLDEFFEDYPASEEMEFSLAKAHIWTRMPFLHMVQYEDFVKRAYEEQYAKFQERMKTITPRRLFTATKRELLAYGYAPRELEGKGQQELTAMLKDNNGTGVTDLEREIMQAADGFDTHQAQEEHVAREKARADAEAAEERTREGERKKEQFEIEADAGAAGADEIAGIAECSDEESGSNSGEDGRDLEPDDAERDRPSDQGEDSDRGEDDDASQQEHDSSDGQDS